MDNPEECKVCFENFDDSARRPRTLPCGHTFCSPCIMDTMKAGHITCPGCRSYHTATHTSQFPINYGMEALVRKLKAVELLHEPSAVLPSAPPLPVGDMNNAGFSLSSSDNISHETKKKLDKQITSINSLLVSYTTTELQLEQYRSQLRAWKMSHLHILEKLNNLLEQTKTTVQLLEKEDSKVMDQQKEGEEDRCKLEVTLGRLHSISTDADTDSAISQAEHCNKKANSWLQISQTQFPDGDIVLESTKLLQQTMKVLDSSEQATAKGPFKLQSNSAASIMQKVDSIIQDNTATSEEIDFEEVRKLRKPIRRLVEEGRVFAIQEGNSHPRSSQITLENGQLYFHYLQDQSPPSNARTLMVSDIMGELDSSSNLVFLDLCWSGIPRRVHIRLSSDTPLARQFLLLCTGVKGHSYYQSVLLEACGLRCPGEFVIGGDYQNNDGTGGAPLLSDLQGHYRESGKAGVVWSRWKDGDPRSAQFAITTRKCKGIVPRVFGLVESGLENVKAAAMCANIKEVTITDCGVVIGGRPLNA